MPKIISQKFKTTWFCKRLGVVVRYPIIPSTIGLVALCTVFCRKPETASINTWVKPSEGFAVWIWDMLIAPEFVLPEDEDKAPVRTETIAPEARTITRPIIAFLIVLLALSRESGLPEDVMYK